MNSRLTVKFGGESGQGINSLGEIYAKAVKDMGLWIFAYREYPSLIQGGYACYQIEVSSEAVNAPMTRCDLLVCISRLSLHKYLKDLNKGGILIHSLPHLQLSEEEQNFITENNIWINYIPAQEITVGNGGSTIMSNMVLLGHTWKLCGFEFELLWKAVASKFAHKPAVLPLNHKILRAGYDLDTESHPTLKEGLTEHLRPGNRPGLVLSGNHALALGAIAAGVRAYYSYPMTPSSSILSYLAELQEETGMLVRQAEDEITAAQMALGSTFMGTRALTATSGGGFDLMTETLSLAAITETPFVSIIAQRPGPATGLPTWTAAADLELAVYSGHGEFTRCVLAVSDPKSAYVLIQKAFDLSEKLQIPVLVLTEKQIAESLFQIDKLPLALPVKRYLVPQNDLGNLQTDSRYALTDSGISPRWLPGDKAPVYLANSDEHAEDGSINEESRNSRLMMEKRMRKHELLLKEIGEPELYGSQSPRILLVGWGGVKLSILDALKHGGFTDVSYLHYEYVYPLNTEKLQALIEKAERVVLVENNFKGQLGNLITLACGYKFEYKLLKYDGRAFFVDEIIDYLKGSIK